MADTLRELSAKYATKQPKQIDYLLEGAKVLGRVPFTPSTHGLQHVYEKLSNIDAATWVQRDEPLPEADVTTTLGSMELGIMGFKVKAGVDKVAALDGKGNFANYLARRVPKIIAKTGMNTNAKFVDLAIKYAINNGNVINAGATTGKVSAIAAIRLIPDEVGGVYDPNGFESGALFETIPLSGGKPYEDSNKQTVYGADFKNYTGFIFENPHAVAAILNIDKDHKITSADMKKLLRKVKAGSVGTTLIVCNPGVADDYIDPLRVWNPTSTENVNTLVSSWDGIEIVRDWTLPETMDVVNIADGENMEEMYKTGELGKEFFKAQVLNSAEPVDSKAVNYGKGGMNAGVAIRVVADSAISAATGAKVTIKHSATEDGEYKTLAEYELEATAKKNALLYEFVLPSTFKGWAKVSVTGIDGATGTITVKPIYKAR